MRHPFIAGNWKMFKTVHDTVVYVKEFRSLVKDIEDVEIVVAPPFTAIHSAAEAARNSNVGIAAQNLHWEREGAFTGEVSGAMVREAGAEYVLIGHSERRQYFNETDTTVNLKLKSALAHSLTPIVCVGEHLNEREQNLTADVLNLQISVALEGIDKTELGPLVIAYEPVWAIGTGRTATPEIAGDAHKIIRAKIASIAGSDVANATRILYGGSVKPDNARSLCCLEDIDGALVGGPSLDPVSFSQTIINATTH